jgi:glycosyltransferase involved in cell wall biosynthesis
MRLLFLNHNARYEGTYYRAMPMAEWLVKRGHQVTLMTVSNERCWTSSHSQVNGVHLIETPSYGQEVAGGYGPLDNGWRILHALRHRYDIIQMFDHKPNATFPGFAGKLRGARLVADWADWWGGPGGINDVPVRRFPVVEKFEGWWEAQSKLWADRIITISTVLRQRAIDLGYPAEHVLYLPTGAALDRIRPMPVAEARQQLGLPPERRIVGFIGMGQGDLELVMSALRQIPGVWLMVIGRKLPAVLEMAHVFGLADRLWQTGYVADEEVALYLACADLMCLPLGDRAANRGRLPNKILDYFAAGRPTVASPVGDIKTFVEQYEAGLLAGDVEAFANSFERLLADASLRERLGRNARQTAETVFNWAVLIEQLETFYRQLCSPTQNVVQ